MNVLEVKNLSVQYPGTEGASEIVKDISFTVEEGGITGIVGQSGSGKSTAMLAVMGLLDGRASVQYGQITVNGKAPAPGRNIAMIFQDSLSCLNPSVKIGRQITETVRMRKGCRAADHGDRPDAERLWQERSGGPGRRTAGDSRDPQSRTPDAAVSL